MNHGIGEFALICSGSDLEILRREECRTDRTKYKMIGIFILLTAIFATLSGGYALYTGFQSVWLGAAVGLLWGIFIFNLDRFIISTLRKKDIDPDLSLFEKTYLKSGEILAAMLRLILAVFISIVISAPLELKYFDPEIQLQMSQTNLNAAIESENKIKGKFSRLETLEAENKRFADELTEKESKCEKLRDLSFGEAEVTSGTGKTGKGPVYREKREEHDRCQSELAQLRVQTLDRINLNREELKPWLARRDLEREGLNQQRDQSKGFLNRLKALHELSSGAGPVGWANIFISMLFILLETTPILMKLLSKKGPYDNLLETSEYEVYLGQQKAISDLNERVNHEIAFNTWKSDLINEAEQRMTEEAVGNLHGLAKDEDGVAQVEVARDIVDTWKNRSLGRTSPFLKSQPQTSNN